MTKQTTNQDDTVDTEAAEGGASDPDATDVHPETSANDPDAVAGGDDAEVADETDQAAESASRDSAPDHRDDPKGQAATDVDLSGLQSEFDTLNDRHLRLVAEFNNFRRRSEQERMSAWTRAQADLVGKLLDVLDDLQRVADLDLSNASVEAIMEGIDLVERKFLRQLEEAGVEMVDPVGEAFDPERMEAMMRVPAEAENEVDTVAQVFQKGYSLKGTLVRPARVSVYTQG